MEILVGVSGAVLGFCAAILGGLITARTARDRLTKETHTDYRKKWSYEVIDAMAAAAKASSESELRESVTRLRLLVCPSTNFAALAETANAQPKDFGSRFRSERLRSPEPITRVQDEWTTYFALQLVALEDTPVADFPRSAAWRAAQQAVGVIVALEWELASRRL